MSAEYYKGKPVYTRNFLSGDNSTESPLTNGSTFTGIIENSVNFNSIKINCFSDTNCLIYLDLSLDGSNIDSTITFNCYQSVLLSVIDSITTPYYRVRVYNNSGSSQSILRLSVILTNDYDKKLYPIYSTLNSTSTPLTSGASFTGVGEDVSNFGVISVAVYSNVASVSLGLEFQFSKDNSTWYTTDEYLYSSVGNVKNYSLAPVLKYFRVHYTNDGSSQSTFFIETSYKQVYVKPSSHRIGDSVSGDDDAELVTAQLVGKTTSAGGGYVSVKVNPSGTLAVGLTTNDIYISIIDEATAGTTYFGWADPGTSTSSALWKIWKITESGGVTTTLKADGNDNFDNVWTSRASLSYS